MTQNRNVKRSGSGGSETSHGATRAIPKPTVRKPGRPNKSDARKPETQDTPDYSDPMLGATLNHHRPTDISRRAIVALREASVPVDKIAEVFGVSNTIIRHHYAKELKENPVEGGRPPHQPTDVSRRSAEMLSGLGVPHEDIAITLGIGKTQLYTHYRNELDLGKVKAQTAVRKSLWLQAVGGPNQEWDKAVPSATIFYGKTQLGMKEQPVEITTPDGKPLQIEEISPRDILFSRLASIAANIRAGEGSGGADGRTNEVPRVGLELLGAPGTTHPGGQVDNLASAGGTRSGQDQNGG